MIDTVELRFHGILAEKDDTLDIIKSHNSKTTNYAVDEHHELYKKMLKYKGKLFSRVDIVSKETTTTEVLSESEFLQLENTKLKDGYSHIKQVMRFIDEKKVNEMTMRVNGKYRTPSSIAAVVFKINENAGFIDFNVSIPKYLYSHSLAEFIPQAGSEEYFNLNNPSSFKSQRLVLMKRFNKFLDDFIVDIAQMFELDVLPNKEYIELRRIDLCYNQYFESKSDALNYLNHQRKITKVKATHSNNKLKEYDTSITYFTTSGAYFKIYHKGTEYVSSKFGDLKKHMEHNRMYLEAYHKKLKLKDKADEITLNEKLFEDYREKLKSREVVQNLFAKQVKGQPISVNKKIRNKLNSTSRLIKRIQPFKIHFLKSEMDKVLRYEMSLRGDFFNYNYKKKVFRKNCPIYKKLKDNHAFVQSVNLSTNPNKPDLSKYQIRESKKIDSFFKKKIGLVFSDNPRLKRFLKTSNLDNNKGVHGYNLKTRFYRYSVLSDKDVGIFNDEMLQICINYFKKTIDSFQLSKLDNYDSLAQKVKEYNESVDIRADNYNRENRFKILDIHGNQKYKGATLLTNATQLLKESEKRLMKLKKVHPLRILQVLRELEKGESLHTIRDKLGLSRSNFSRLKSDLKMFEVFESTLELHKDFNPEISYRQYYFNTESIKYQDKFYFKKKHYKNG